MGFARRLALAGVTFALSGLLWVVPAEQAEAVSLNISCAEVVDTLSNGSQFDQAGITGIEVGVTSAYADVVCFVGGAACQCLRDAVDPETATAASFQTELAQILAECVESAPMRTLSGVVQQAVFSVCDPPAQP